MSSFIAVTAGNAVILRRHPGIEGTDSHPERPTWGNQLIVLGLGDLLHPFWCIILVDDQNDGVVATFFCLPYPSERLLEVALSFAVMGMDIFAAHPVQVALDNVLVQTPDRGLQGPVSVLLPPFMLALGNEENSHDIVSLGLP
jgi:hypothetical protein